MKEVEHFTGIDLIDIHLKRDQILQVFGFFLIFNTANHNSVKNVDYAIMFSQYLFFSIISLKY